MSFELINTFPLCDSILKVAFLELLQKEENSFISTSTIETLITFKGITLGTFTTKNQNSELRNKFELTKGFLDVLGSKV